ncbi:M48 family metalloprotease [Orrella marina]|uniref:Peptidase n=1 Tax=Orrella marina TaxID=2163011 RepID=A0A2R4XNL9_9BURK|nr:M48 family metalloprotease [Orrella marina]AWB35364.1 peptidase [Orrella marina]
MIRHRPAALSRAVILSLSLALPQWVMAPAFAQPMGLPSMGSASGFDLSPAVERQIGELIMTQGRRDPSYVHDAEINQYLNRMASKLVRYAPGGATNIELFAVRDPGFNAFAMPGGFIGINTGVIAVTDNESELAGVVAHEISHVTQRHIARGVTQQKQNNAVMLASIAGALLAGLTGGVGLGAGIAAFGQAAAIDRQLGFSREAEKEADRVGLQMLGKAGYNPNGMQDMFAKLMQASNLNQGTTGGGTYLSTHPLSIDRMGDMQNRTRSMGMRAHRDSDDYWYVRARALTSQSHDRATMLRVRDRLLDESARASGVRRSAAFLALAEMASRQGRFDEALDFLAKARQGVPDSPYLARQQAWIELLRGQPKTVVNLTQSALRKWPDHVALSEVQAHALQQTGDYRQAADVLERVLKKWPRDYPNLYQMRANALNRAGDSIQSRMAMAEYYVMTGAFVAAIAQLEQARSMTNDFRVQSTLDVKVREIKVLMDRERSLLEQFGA